MRRNLVIFSVALFFFVLGALSFYIVSFYFPMNVKITKVNKLEISETSINKSIEKVFDSTVVVEVYKGQFLFATGSGFVYKKTATDGYIVTNFHVVDGATAIKIKFSDDSTTLATVAGKDQRSDLAVLKVSADKVKKVATLGKSSELKTGDVVFTIGSPESSDYSGTVTKGIVSSDDRLLNMTLGLDKYALRVIQTDAAINPGNSGGPLVNINGDVIGITSLKLGTSEKIEGIGFAMPIDEVLGYISKLEVGKTIIRPTVDFNYVSLSNTSVISSLGLMSDGSILSGVMVIFSSANSFLKPGHIITSVDGVEVTNSYYFDYLISKYEPNSVVTVKYYDGKSIKTAKITLVARK